jgi:hypothetical protein
MFIAAFYHQAMKTAQMPCTDEWIKKMWYIPTMEYYSVIKKNEILSFTGKWMELENIMLNEVSQVWQDKGHMFSLTCRGQIQYNKSIILNTYKYILCMFPNVRLLERD